MDAWTQLLLIANIVTTSKAPVTRSDALVPNSFLLLLVRHLFLVQMEIGRQHQRSLFPLRKDTSERSRCRRETHF